MKQCIKCKKILDIKNYYKKSTSKDGVQNWCKKCDEKRKQLWRKNNREKVVEQSRLQRIRYPEKMRAFVREYAKNHPEKSRARNKKWRIKKDNKIKISAHKKVSYAIKIGKIKIEKCFCGEIAQAHHENYNKPLEIIWLCPIHHKARHMELDKKL